MVPPQGTFSGGLFLKNDVRVESDRRPFRALVSSVLDALDSGGRCSQRFFNDRVLCW